MRRNHWPGIFISVEGICCSGKTTALSTAIDTLGVKHNLVYLKGAGSNTFWGRLSKHFGWCLFLVLEVITITLFPLRRALKAGKVVLMDKYYFSSASHIPESRRIFNRLMWKITKPLMIQPDLVIYTTVATDERINRLKAVPNRYHQILIDTTGQIEAREEKYRNVLAEIKNMPVVTLDSTGLSPKQNFQQFQRTLEEFLRKE